MCLFTESVTVSYFFDNLFKFLLIFQFEPSAQSSISFAYSVLNNSATLRISGRNTVKKCHHYFEFLNIHF